MPKNQEQIDEEVEISDEEFDLSMATRKNFRERIETVEPRKKDPPTHKASEGKSEEKLESKPEEEPVKMEPVQEKQVSEDQASKITENEPAEVVSDKKEEPQVEAPLKLDPEEKLKLIKQERQKNQVEKKQEESPVQKPLESENANTETVELVKEEVGEQADETPEETGPVQQEEPKVEVDSRLLSIPSEDRGSFEFPEDFLWGTSTSAYQIEGGIENDWSDWEKSNKRIEQLEKKGKNIDEYICGSACDFWNKYEEDFDAAKALSTNAIRFGIEWARIETGNNVWDVEAVKKYREILEAAKKRGFKVVLTIWHWTNPKWFRDEGGWAGKKAVTYFDRFSKFAVKEFGGYVDYWVTLNEPMVHVINGYWTGKFPPAKHSIFKTRKVCANLVKGHKKAYDNIHSVFPDAEVSITGLINDFQPANKLFVVDLLLTKIFHYFWNHRFLSKIKKHMDYVGVDYYFHDRVVCYPPFRRNKNERTTDMGWEIYPKGIYNVLKYLKRFKKPIIILENGIADAHDQHRATFIKEHLYWVHRAMKEGVDIRGYFHWSLLDNFEWAAGFDSRFGLYAIDYKTQKRTLRPSGLVYKDICENNRVEI